MKQIIITSKNNVLTKFSNGENDRKKFNLDEIDKTDEKVEVIISKNVLMMSMTYFAGLFGKSMKKLKHEFKNKYEFSFDDDILEMNMYHLKYKS